MKFKAVYSIALSIVLGTCILSNTADAALIKEVWTYKITGATGNYLTKDVGDIVSMAFVFDNESQEKTRNINSQTIVLCAANSIVDNCDSKNRNYRFFADIVSTDALLPLFDWNLLEKNGGTEYNRNVITYANRSSKYHVDGTEEIEIAENKHRFYATDSQNPSLVNLNFFHFYYRDINNRKNSSEYSADLISRSVQSVSATSTISEPYTFAISLSAMLFFGIRRLKDML